MIDHRDFIGFRNGMKVIYKTPALGPSTLDLEPYFRALEYERLAIEQFEAWRRRHVMTDPRPSPQALFDVVDRLSKPIGRVTE